MPTLEKIQPRQPAARGHRRKPLYEQVRDSLSTMIEQNFSDGELFYSEKRLVDSLSVSQITVRRALQELAAAGLLERSQGKRAIVRKPLHTRTPSQPNVSVRVPTHVDVPVSPWQVRKVGIFVPQRRQVSSEYGMEMVASLYAECEARGLQTQIYDASSSEAVAREFGNIGAGSPEEAFVLFSNSDNTLILHHALANRGFCTVAMEGAPENYPGLVVETDAREAVRLGLSHLLSLGHTRIVMLVNEPTFERSVAEKISEFSQLTRAAGIADTCAVVDCRGGRGRSFDCAYEHISTVLTSDVQKCPTAIFTVSDPGAWAVLRWCAQNGIRVPEDVSVLGFEDARSSQYMHPALSSVAHSIQQLAKEVIKVVTGEITTPETKRIEIPPFLVVRESTGPVPA